MLSLLKATLNAAVGDAVWRRIRQTGKRLLGRSLARPYGRERSVEQAVAYTLKSVDMFRGFLALANYEIAGKTVLEIGPGQDLGVPLVLAGFGSRAVVLDQYPSPWDASFHPDYYSELLRQATAQFPGAKFDVLGEVVRRRNYRVFGLEIHNVGLERAGAIPEESIDVTISNAVFEHLADPAVAVSQLFRIASKGGIGFHQVDFRDHHDYSKPLEFLTIDEKVFRDMIATNAGTSGNRVRWSEYQNLFVNAGFTSTFEPEYSADPIYFADVQTRMIERYRAMPSTDVAVLSGRFFLKK